MTTSQELSSVLAAMEDNLHRHFAFVPSQASGMLVEAREDLLIVDSGLASDTFNQVARARLSEADADARIADVIGRFRAAGRPFSWWVGPGTRPLDLERRLEAAGLHAVEGEDGMAIDAARLPASIALPQGLEIRRVSSAAELEGFARVLAACFDPPDKAVLEFYRRAAAIVLREHCPMRMCCGFVEGQAVATSELFLSGATAGVHNVATLAAFQRRGYGLALTWAALDEGRRAGATLATLQASEQGRPVYERLGFEAVCRFTEYKPR